MTRLIILIAMLLSTVTCAHATPAEPEDGARPDRAKKIERLRVMRGKLLRRELGVDGSKAAEVEAVLTRFDPLQEQARKRLRKAHKVVKGLLMIDSDDQDAYAQAVDDDHGHCRFPIIEHKRAGVERIVDALRNVSPKSTGHVQRELPWRDINGDSSGTQTGLLATGRGNSRIHSEG